MDMQDELNEKATHVAARVINGVIYPVIDESRLMDKLDRIIALLETLVDSQ